MHVCKLSKRSVYTGLGLPCIAVAVLWPQGTVQTPSVVVVEPTESVEHDNVVESLPLQLRNGPEGMSVELPIGTSSWVGSDGRRYQATVRLK